MKPPRSYLEDKLKLGKIDQNKCVFGDLQVLFAGDSGQLHPVSGVALFKAKRNEIENPFWDKITTYFELKSSRLAKKCGMIVAMLQKILYIHVAVIVT